MVDLRPNGAIDKHLRKTLWVKFLKICLQSSIDGLNVGGTVGFEFKKPYKSQMVVQRKTLGILKIQLLRYQLYMDLANFEALRSSSVFQGLSKEMQDLLTRMMLTPEEATQEIVVVDTPKSARVIVEVPKSPRTTRPLVSRIQSRFPLCFYQGTEGPRKDMA